MNRRSSSITLTSGLIGLNALVWLAFGIAVAAGAHPALPPGAWIRWTMASLAVATTLLLIGILIMLRRKSRLAYYAALALFVAISVLTITDQFGLADLVVLILNLLPIWLLIKDRNWYLSPPASISPGRTSL